MRAQEASVIVAIAMLGLLASACKGSTTTPSADESDEDVAAVATTVEAWESVVPVGGSTFYSFSVGATGSVNATLVSAGGPFVPATVMLGMGLGTPSGTGCSTTSTTTVQAGGAAQVTATFDPGLYCASVADIGNLFSAASISVSVEHP